MRQPRRIIWITAAIVVLPAPAYAAGGRLEPAISTGAGILALLAAAALLIEMLALRRLADGAAIAENITYAVLGTMCLAASILTGWLARFLPAGFTADQARLGSDLSVLASLVLFGVYFFRVRRAMSRFLGRLAEQEQEIVGALDPDAAGEVLQERDGG